MKIAALTAFLFLTPLAVHAQTPPTSDAVATERVARVAELKTFLAASDAHTAAARAQIKSLQDQIDAIEGADVRNARRELRTLESLTRTKP